jgi:hypothetical protein
MCVQFWHILGCPALRSPEIDRVAMLVDRLHQFSPVGGNLHMITDEWNLSTDVLQFCAVTLAGSGEWLDGHPTQHDLERRILYLMMPMSVAERASALAIQQGLVPVADA